MLIFAPNPELNISQVCFLFLAPSKVCSKRTGGGADCQGIFEIFFRPMWSACCELNFNRLKRAIIGAIPRLTAFITWLWFDPPCSIMTTSALNHLLNFCTGVKFYQFHSSASIGTPTNRRSILFLKTGKGRNDLVWLLSGASLINFKWRKKQLRAK